MSRPGEDLELAPGPGLPRGLVLPAVELVERFSRSSGPGGQSVNTTDSRVELEYDVAASAALTQTRRARAWRRWRPAGGRPAAGGRRQRAPLPAPQPGRGARGRMAELLRAALAPRRRPAGPRSPPRPASAGGSRPSVVAARRRSCGVASARSSHPARVQRLSQRRTSARACRPAR
ncbi:MAG: aminoacyl-tRNA hydrolase [Nocardioides sp.]